MKDILESLSKEERKAILSQVKMQLKTYKTYLLKLDKRKHPKFDAHYQVMIDYYNQSIVDVEEIEIWNYICDFHRRVDRLDKCYRTIICEYCINFDKPSVISMCDQLKFAQATFHRKKQEAQLLLGLTYEMLK